MIITGSLWRYDTTSAYWRACLLGNWAAHFFKHTYEFVQAVQDKLEYGGLDEQVSALILLPCVCQRIFKSLHCFH
jgi:hypothetical protein